METVERAIEVKAPLQRVYNQWTQFEEFPRFMEGIESVRQLDDKRLHWIAFLGGKQLEWDAEITEQVPDRRIAWRSIGGKQNEGVVTFQNSGESKTLVRVAISYEPEGAKEKIGDALGLAGARVKGDLERFKDFIENLGQETGAWRGEIHSREAS
jgi:uncharacterized membrane protein